MAKSSSFFGIRSGSTKSHTYAPYRGQQVTKDRVTQISNPQTDAQMKQRYLVPMVAAARVQLKDLVNHSFQGVPYGYQSVQRFSSLNLRKGAIRPIEYVPKGAMDPGISTLIVSDGTLPSVEPTDEASVGLVIADGRVNGIQIPYYANDKPNGELPFGDLLPLADAKKGTAVNKKIVDAILGAQNLLQRGDQLTFVYQLTSEVYGTYLVKTEGPHNTLVDRKAARSRFAVSRFIFDENKLAGWTVKEDMTGSKLVLTNGVVDMYFLTHIGAGQAFIQVTQPDTAAEAVDPAVLLVTAGTAILSREVNGKWQRSPARLVIAEGTYNEGYGDDNAWSMSTYKKAAGASNRYLNNGSDATGLLGDAK